MIEVRLVDVRCVVYVGSNRIGFMTTCATCGVARSEHAWQATCGRCGRTLLLTPPMPQVGASLTVVCGDVCPPVPL